MKFRQQALRALPVVMLVWSLLPEVAQAQFIQQAKLVGTGAVGDTEQGRSVSLSGDGSTAIVGGPLDNSLGGAAWVYTRSGGVWTQQAKLVSAGVVGPFASARQGDSVSLSGDGNTAIVGGPADGYGGAGVPRGAGAAWVYTRSAGVWSQQAKLVGSGAIGPAEQGRSVLLSGDGNTAIVGGSGDDNFVGAAWVFTRSGGVWSQQAKLVGTGPVGFTQQGYSVSLSGDGNTAIVGGVGVIEASPAWVFTRSAGVWNQQAKLVQGPVGAFGPSVSLSGDGNTAMVGVYADDNSTGAAWVYTRSDGVWTQQGPKLVGTGAIGPALQGWSVSLSGDGNIAIVGALGDNSEVGAAWVYTRSAGVWSQQAKLVGSGAIGPVEQGQSVSLSGDGSTAIVGGPSDDGDLGAAWVFTQPAFAGMPGKANCHGQSVSALARQFGGLNAAAADLAYASVGALQDAILAFCEG